MAVQRLWGTCDGIELRFTRDEMGRWIAAAPSDPDNTYVVELWAEDTAGNVGHFATVLYTFDPVKLQYRIECLSLDADPHLAEYCLKL